MCVESKHTDGFGKQETKHLHTFTTYIINYAMYIKYLPHCYNMAGCSVFAIGEELMVDYKLGLDSSTSLQMWHEGS